MLRAQIPLFSRVSRAGAAVAAAFVVLLCTAPIANGNLRHGVVWYSSPTDTVVLNTAASRYELGVTGKDNPSSKIAIKQLNPSFQWYVYNSASDNYVSPPSSEHLAVWNLAAQKGWNPEEIYMHYWDDTRTIIQGDTLFIPGWGGGSATSPEQARIPVYYKDKSRAVVNFSTPRALQLNKEIFVGMAFDTPFAGSSIYPDGIFLDNSASHLFNYGAVLSGGHVREAAGQAYIASPQFVDWYWNQNYGPFLTALKDTLETSATWTPDHVRKRLMINVANIWDDGYITRDAADVIFMEFEYNPIRDFGTGMITEACRREALASSAGIDLFYPAATGTNSVAGHTGALSYGQVMLGNLAWFLVSRTRNSIFFEMGSSSPHIAGWDTLTWRGCLDVADQQMGEAMGDPFQLDAGTDPLGHPYTVHARFYEGGMAVVRNRGNWSEGIEPETAVSVNLPVRMQPVSYDGTVGALADQVTLRNGEGAIFLGQVPTAVTLLSLNAARSDEGSVLTWTVAGDPTDLAGFNVYREDAAGVRERLTPTLLTGGPGYRWVDPDPPSRETNYWLAETARDGGLVWHGPVILAAGGAIPVAFTLAQNSPNPFRGTTAIRFRTGAEGPVILRVLDLAGREIARPLDGVLPSGDHEVVWDGRTARGGRAAPGVYFYRVEGTGRSLSRKLTLLP